MRVCVDPGHGGKDPGAIGYKPWRLREAEVVWSVSTVLRHVLEADGHQVLTTRRQGEYVGLAERARRANAWGADLFVSVHCNSFADPAAHGLEVLHYGSEAGEQLARSILDEIFESTYLDRFEIRYRGLKRRPGLAVLRLTRMPAALVELPFISNPTDHAALVDPQAQVEYALAVARGLTKFRESRT